MSYCIKASTPEAMRDEIVKWLNQQASNHRVASRIASRKTMQKSEACVAASYEEAARFLAGCTVEVPEKRDFPPERMII